jgi:hypothetical protein
VLTTSLIPAAAIPFLAALAPALVVGACLALKRAIGDRRTERAMRKELARRLANHHAVLTDQPLPADPQVLPRVAAAGE